MVSLLRMEAAPVVEAFFDAFFEAVVGGLVVGSSIGHIRLGDVAFIEVVGVVVLKVGVGGVVGAGDFFAGLGAEVGRDGEGATAFDIGDGGIEGGVGAVGFWGGGEVNGGVGERDAAFGHAEEIEGLLGGEGDSQGVGIGESDVFAGGDDEAAGDKAWVFSGAEHFGQPVEGGIGVAATDGFDKGRGGVVVGVPIGIVNDGLFLDGFGGDIESEVDAALVVGWSGEDGEFEGVEGFADIAVGHLREVVKGVLIGLDVVASEAVYGVGQGALEGGDEVGGGDGFELEDLRARDEWGVDVEVGVVRGGSDEADGAAFDVGEEDVLLGFIKAMDFVDEEDGGLVA